MNNVLPKMPCPSHFRNYIPKDIHKEQCVPGIELNYRDPIRLLKHLKHCKTYRMQIMKSFIVVPVLHVAIGMVSCFETISFFFCLSLLSLSHALFLPQPLFISYHRSVLFVAIIRYSITIYDSYSISRYYQSMVRYVYIDYVCVCVCVRMYIYSQLNFISCSDIIHLFLF